MEAPVPAQPRRASSLPPSVTSLHALNIVQHAPRERVNHSAPTETGLVSSHEDDDAKGSDCSRFHSQLSTVSSRITTPEIPNVVPRPFHLYRASKIARDPDDRQAAPFANVPSKIDHNAPEIVLAQSNQSNSHPVAGGFGHPQKHQPRQWQSISEQLHASMSDDGFVTSQHGRDRPLFTSESIPPIGPEKMGAKTSPQRFRAHSVSTTPGGARVSLGLDHIELSPHPTAFFRQSRSISDYGASRVTSHFAETAFSVAKDHSASSNGLRYISNPAMPRRHLDHSRSSEHDRNEKVTEASVSSDSDSDGYSDESSEFLSSEDDPIAYRNARRFPPRLPMEPSRIPSRAQGDMSAMKKVTSWVASREQGRGHRSTGASGDGMVNESSLDATVDDVAATSSNVSSEDEIDATWQTLKEKRAKVADLRLQMAQTRKELRQARQKKNSADNAFMGLVRPLLAKLVNQHDVLHAPKSLFERRWTDMQRLGDEYHFLESNYEELEDFVDEEEESLSRLETRFFSLLAAGQGRASKTVAPPYLHHTPGHNESTNTPDILLGISQDGPKEDLHPLYVELTAAIGDLENTKEDYNDLCWLKRHYDEEAELKQRTGQKIPRRLREFLEEFPEEESLLKDSIVDLQNVVNRLRQLCEEKKVMRKHMSARMIYLLDPGQKVEEIELDNEETILEKHKTLAHARFPELLSQPDHVLAEPHPLTPLGSLKHAINLPEKDPEKQAKKRLASKEYSIGSLLQDTIGGADKMGYVNRWLLQSLRLSPLNLILLHTIFVSSCLLKIRDPWRWQCDVLHYWWNDQTTRDTSRALATSTYLRYSSHCDTTPQVSMVTSAVDSRPG